MYPGLILFVVALLLLPLLILRMRRIRLLEQREARQAALEHIRFLRLLLEMLQQHRGLCFGVMSGESGLKTRLWATQQQVQLLLVQSRQYQASLFWYPSWHHIVELWPAISSECEQDGEAESILQMHNRLVGLVLETIREMADKHDFICQGGIAPQPQGGWLELLEHTELLGQARAIGTGMAARRQNTALQRDELNLLRHRIADQAYLTLARLHADAELRPLVAEGINEAEESLDLLLDLIDQLLASDMQPDVRSVNYFHCATRVISAHLALVDMLLERQQERASPD
ncbi:MAG TPA: hypothetical protein ENI17_09295 [Pseudomonas xinjiangensis]|uniref:Nitrate/nitrite sensing protein domain-containing protein n=2 Tax=root TaxID=1 RepID=A0A7V1BKX3_9GAMM|nr:hypothetical protein [Halopseudomonas xinjiangensis]HEC47810.1 hypothetical protein [Halopseudomonas xinjiangensis]